MTSSSYHRRWRTWALVPSETITWAELFAGVSEILSRIIADAEKQPGRWLELVGHVDTLPAADRDRLLDAFQVFDPDSLGNPGRREMWRALVDLGAQHRQFSNAPWVMPSDVIDRVEAVAAHFAPTSPVDLSVDLFDQRPHLPGVDRLGPEYDGALQTARQDAARSVIEAEGIPGLLRLGAEAMLPIAVGWVAAEARGDDLADDLLPLLGIDGSDGWVAHGYAGGRIEADGLDWLIRQLQRWPGGDSVPQQVGLLIAVTRPNEDLITIVDGLHPDVQTPFWQHVNTMFIHPDTRPIVAHSSWTCAAPGVRSTC
jgi:hypothetical protein